MSDLNEKYKKMLNQDPIIDSDQSLNKDLHEYNKKVAQEELNKKGEIVESAENIKVNLDYEYGDPVSFEEHTPSDKFKISKYNGIPEKYAKREKGFLELVFHRFLLVFVIGLIAAFVMVYRVNSYVKPDYIAEAEEAKVTETTKTEPTKTEYRSLSLTDQYYTNAIKISRVEFEDDTSGDKSEYIQIDGLRNETLEKKINEKLKSEAERIRKEIIDQNPDATDYSVTAYVTANYGNLISVRYQAYAKTPDNSGVGGNNWNIGVNLVTLSLVDGRELYLDDIFAPESINNILLSSSYNYFIQDHTEINNNNDFSLSPSKEAGQVENEQYDLVYKISNNIKNYKINVKPNGVVVFLKDQNTGYDLITNSNEDIQKKNYWKELTIEFTNFYDKVILFHKNQEENLYDGKYMAVGPFDVFTNSINVLEKIYQVGDNYHVDYTIAKNDNKDVPNDIQKTISTYISEKLSEQLKTAKENKNKYTVFSGNVSINFNNYIYNPETDMYEKSETKGSYHCSGTIEKLETNKDRFRKVIYNQSLQSARSLTYEGVGVSYWDNSKESTSSSMTIDLELDNLGNIIKEYGKDMLPGIED